MPDKNSFDNFYILFNKEKREEYYSTPMYTYKTNATLNSDNRLMNISFKKTEEGLKYLGNLCCPYVERFGMFLLRFLNSNLDTFELKDIQILRNLQYI